MRHQPFDENDNPILKSAGRDIRGSPLKQERICEIARQMGLIGSDEQIMLFVEHIEAVDRAQHVLMNHNRLMKEINMSRTEYKEVKRTARQGKELAERIAKDFYETYEVEEDKE